MVQCDKWKPLAPLPYWALAQRQLEEPRAVPRVATGAQMQHGQTGNTTIVFQTSDATIFTQAAPGQRKGAPVLVPCMYDEVVDRCGGGLRALVPVPVWGRGAWLQISVR